jgi:hypothetical protein
MEPSRTKATTTKPGPTPPAPEHELERHPHFQHDPHLPAHVARRLHHVGRMILETPQTPVLDPVEFREFMLIGKSNLSNNTSRWVQARDLWTGGPRSLR